MAVCVTVKSLTTEKSDLVMEENMKKIMLVVLCVLILAGTVFAGGKQDSGPMLNKSTNNQDLVKPGLGKDYGFGPVGFDFDALVKRLGPEAVKRLKIGISVPSLAAYWYIGWVDEAKDLAKQYGFEVVVLSGEADATKQAEDMRAFRSQQVDGIVIFAMNADALASTITEVYNSGIPIVSCVPVAPGTKVSTSINVSQAAKGAMIADRMAQDANGQPRNVLIFDRATDIPIFRTRVQGFRDQVAAKYPNIKIIEERRENSDDAFLNLAKESFMTKEEINVVLCPFVLPLIAAQKAAQELGRADKTYFYGIDTDEAGLLMLREGKFTGVHIQWPKPQMATCLFNLFRVFGGEQLPEFVWESDAYAMFYASKNEADLALRINWPDKYK
jgi:ribose transport system substrate-binding protein